MKRILSLILAAVMMAAVFVPAALAAEDIEIYYPRSILISEDKTELRKVYELTPEADPVGIPRSDFEQGGFHYTLAEVLKQDMPELEERFHTETITVDSKKKDMESVLALLPQEKEFVTEDGLVGTLTLRLDTVRVEVSGYGKTTKELSATRTYPNLIGQDTEYIPKTIEDGGNTLSLADIQWQTDNTADTDGYDLGDRFTAIATYTGSTTSSYVKGYTVTADYCGTVSHIALNRVRYVAIFEGYDLNTQPEVIEEPEPVSEPEPEIIEEPAPANETRSVEPVAEAPAAVSFPWGTVVVVLCVVGVIAGGVIVALTLRRKSENESEDDAE